MKRVVLKRCILISVINLILLGKICSGSSHLQEKTCNNSSYSSEQTSNNFSHSQKKTCNNSSHLSKKICSDSQHLPQNIQDIYLPKTSGIRTDILKNITFVVEKSIAAQHYPGAVILVEHRGKIIYRGVFGNRRILPNIAPMRENTIFDLASLTKVLATTPAIMQLIEQGQLTLDAAVATYWPAFGKHGKDKITIRELLTHESGLPADIPIKQQSKLLIYQQIEQLSLPPSSSKHFLYSDINFIVLAHLVEIVSGEPFNIYCKHHIFDPLGMKNTYFLPKKSLHDLIAPTEISSSQLLWGIPQDPLSQAIGGISGNAGLFSNAHDISLYLQCLLNGGRIGKTNHYLLGPLSILKMTTPQTPPNDANVRGLGWDIDSVYSNRGILFPMTSYGHTGWTGTSIWVDPTTQTYIIILTSRLHPHAAAHNSLIEDRRLIANFVAASITDISTYTQRNTGLGELSRAYS